MIQYYKILGVPSNASLRQVKKAFRKKAFEIHPDHNESPNAKEEFIRLQKAYDYVVDVLSGKAKVFERPQQPKPEKRQPTQQEILRKRKRDKIVFQYSNLRRALDKEENGMYIIAVLIGFVAGVFISLAVLNIVTIVFCPGLCILATSKFTYNIYLKKRKEAYRQYKMDIRSV